MDIQTFLTECLMRGVHIDVDGDSLRVESSGKLKPATANYIKQHKKEIIEVLTKPLPHGPCFQCGANTEAMLTRPDSSWDWMCPPCFDRGARPLPDTQKAVQGESVRPI